MEVRERMEKMVNIPEIIFTAVVPAFLHELYKKLKNWWWQNISNSKFEIDLKKLNPHPLYQQDPEISRRYVSDLVDADKRRSICAVESCYLNNLNNASPNDLYKDRYSRQDCCWQLIFWCHPKVTLTEGPRVLDDVSFPHPLKIYQSKDAAKKDNIDTLKGLWVEMWPAEKCADHASSFPYYKHAEALLCGRYLIRVHNLHQSQSKRIQIVYKLAR